MTKNGANAARTGKRLVGGWHVTTRLGKGGNGEVFRAEKDGVVGAIKLLGQRNLVPGRVARFRDEVQAMRQCADIAGVLPVLDANLEPAAGAQPWFVMGLARPIEVELGERPSLRRVVEALAALAMTLQTMHARGFSHRDIKPDNLFFSGGRWTVGDFGLVSFEGKTSETERGERIGPTFFIAPEMLNDAMKADGRCADVFSLAKTLWVLATGQRFPMPGAYDTTQDAFRIASYIAEERTGPLDKLIASATVFAPSTRPTMGQVVAELSGWLTPSPRTSTGFTLDTSAFAAELERRRLAVDAANERQKRTAGASRQAGLRLRESLRPMAKEIEEALQRENFDPVSLNIDNYQWGFEVQAAIPDDAGQTGRINLSVGIDPNDNRSIQVWCRIVLETNAPAMLNVLLWDKAVSFLEGGSQEELQMEQLRGDIRRQFPTTVTTALSMVLGRNGSVASPALYEIQVRNRSGEPVPRADILLVGLDGVFLRSTTNPAGRATFGPTPLGDVAAFVAHPQYHGACLHANGPSFDVTLNSQDGVGSMIATSGWISVSGLVGQVSLIHDAQRRTYIYGENVAIDGGAQQPVNVALGTKTELKGTDGTTVSIVPKAIRGPCFLLDVVEQTAVG